MDVSIFLARFFGLCFLIFIPAIFCCQSRLKSTLLTYAESPAMLNISAILAVIGGLLLVLFHNIWVLDWRVLVTLVCWWVLIRGLIQLYFPKFFLHMINLFIGKPVYLYFIGAVFSILALILLYKGFAGMYILHT